MLSPQFSEEPKEDRFRHWPEAPQVLLHRLLVKVEGVLLGKQEVIKHTLTALLAGGHVLLEDVPGVGKTLLAQAFARAVGGDFKRIQFTSDMLPADVVGGVVLDARTGELVYRPGPIMGNVVLADEINRTSPRTQSALLEAMEERRVTVEGKTRRLPVPFMLIATQNPLSFEGTNTLPEAQLDRFMMRLTIGYPGSAEEKRMLEQYAGGSRVEPERLRPVIATEEWLQMQAEARQTHMHPALLDYMVQVADATRRSPEVALGLSPRALRDWLRASQAIAYMEGRGYAVPDDLLATADAVLPHRLSLRHGAAASGASAAAVIRRAVRECPLPAAAGIGHGGGRRR
ncbi:AAA family ATPase [Paenibacillus arenilitoris]|uniref:MoxR family ATPase n=1 Tax=Paenibacillus arenilitoris TaxID=2772299 RepID=A0A927H855_9BACL|nr:MoxR family ATPase [Paenibacillus arenilitoris]MBD2871217.1 MoxR family ATPase [Paenibacillus arenilitoris]